MNKKEVNELKRRYTKDGCSVSQIAGCYVDSTKDKILTFDEPFLSLPEEEFFKYLEIIKKCLSGTVGNNLLTLDFPTEIEMQKDSFHQALQALRDSALKDENILNAVYDRIIETYDYPSNYLILFFCDAYDVPMKTTDDLGLGDSEDVYNYLICAICPVNLDKPTLSYHKDENKIAPKDREWVVSVPDSAFLFPAFTDRAADIHHVLVYTKTVKEPHREFWENGLACPGKYTAKQKQTAFNNIIENRVGENNDNLDDIKVNVQENINSLIERDEEINKGNPDQEDFIIPDEKMKEVLTDSGVSEDRSDKIVEDYKEFFSDDKPLAEDLIDSRIMKDHELREEKNELKEQVHELQEKLKNAGVSEENDDTDVDLYVKIRPDMADSIDTSFVNGVSCLVIPIGDMKHATINGEVTEL